MTQSVDVAMHHGGWLEADCIGADGNQDVSLKDKRIVMSLENFNEFVEDIKQRERARCALACEGHGFGGVFAAMIRGLE